MRADIAACSLPQLSNQVEYSTTPLLGKKHLADLGSATGLGLDPAAAWMEYRDSNDVSEFELDYM